jgi:hypothetical protein
MQHHGPSWDGQYASISGSRDADRLAWPGESPEEVSVDTVAI